MIHRRLFMNMLGLGGIAASLNNEAIGKQGVALGGDYPFPTNGIVSQDVAIPWDPIKQVKYLKEELASLEDKETFIANYRNRHDDDMDLIDMHRRVDLNLRAMRSFSDVTKVRLHNRRRAEKDWQRRRESLLGQISNLLEGNKS